MRHGFRMSVGADAGGVGKVKEAFAGFAEGHALPEETRRSLNVALDELLANELSHATAGRDGCLVTVEAELNQGRVTVTLTDDGPPFDPFRHAAPDTTLSVEERPIGGLGLHLVQELMDEVRYQRRNGHNVVVLVKELVND